MKLEIGKIYRMASKHRESEPEVDNLHNFYYYTNINVPGWKSSFAFQKGIHNVAKVMGSDDKERCPLIIISSSSHKAGTEQTPWENTFDSDHGYIKYYGDNKEVGKKAEEASGNRVLLDEIINYNSKYRSKRMDAIPIVFFDRVTVDGRRKGNIKFHGFGIIENAELVTQYDINGGYFSNYLFDCCIFSIKEEDETFSWDWIAARCNKDLTLEETLQYAPASWKKWIREGNIRLQSIRRKVSVLNIVKTDEQKPVPGSKEYKTLKEIYDHYSKDNKKHVFELLAMRVTQYIFEEGGSQFIPGWVTCKSGDKGIDFVSRVDIGTGLAGLKIVILGQAKCEGIDSPTNANAIARTVARLKRGWLGVYVTTSYFSEPMQGEIIEDQYPIMLVNGLKVAQIVNNILYKSGESLEEFLKNLDNEYEKSMRNRIPEEVLKI